MVKYFKANRSVCYVDWCLACLCKQMEFGKVDGLPGAMSAVQLWQAAV